MEEKWRGDTQEEGLLPEAGGCGVKGEKNTKTTQPHSPDSSRAGQCGMGVLIRTEGETKKKQPKGRLGRGGAPCLSRAGFL